MELTDKIWKKLDGGYKTPYDASIALRLLEETNNPDTITKVYQELWTELHHQGGYSDQTEPPIPRESEQGKLNSFFV